MDPRVSRLVLFLQLLLLWCSVDARAPPRGSCPREPKGVSTPKTDGDNGYHILISGEPQKYVPGAIYTVSIVGSRTHARLQRFTRFALGVEPVESRGIASPQRVGHFQLFGDSITAFNEDCINSVMEASPDFPKTEVQVMWTAPRHGSGCIVFRAMVYENANSWFMDDGALSRELCELDEEDDEDDPTADELGPVKECCACDEAKYQLIFEGLWSNATHPRDFPFSLWLTHFSDVIGASHDGNFTLWEEGGLASAGLRQVAEWGSVRTIEGELRAKRKYLRTIIKAGGLWYPRVNANTTSNFKVDRLHHLLSVVSMLGPSPDWIVGVSRLDLCRRDCTWVPSKTIDLYLYDAGTDDGITYMSPNAPSEPQQPIRRITPTDPGDPRSPFFDPTANNMAPIARLFLTREKTFERTCDTDFSRAGELDELGLEPEFAENSEDSLRPECTTTDWSEWSTCSVSCGKGLRMRTRQYVMQAKAEMLGCDRQLVAKEMCVAEDRPFCPGESGGDIYDTVQGPCAVTNWGNWSPCSPTACGDPEGFRTRFRRFRDRMGRKKCPHVSLVQREECVAEQGGGADDLTCAENEEQVLGPASMCNTTKWSEWSPCSVSCGDGIRRRIRFYTVGPEVQAKCNLPLEQEVSCKGPPCTINIADAKEACMEEVEVGPCRGSFPRWYFEPAKRMCVPFIFGGCRGNRNNFRTREDCIGSCGIIRDMLEANPLEGPASAAANTLRQTEEDLERKGFYPPKPESRIDCVATDWSSWGPCSVSCGSGFKEKVRVVKVAAVNGGKPCPRKLLRRKKCHLPVCLPEEN
ncbi:spondin-1 [Hetaerina americana]|uniref:spondin-1 n=1 Tax=Hetaerina americana TaxID=62018 RepID=UPI003A7F536E